MADELPRRGTDPMYLLLTEGRADEFNRRRKAGEAFDLRSANLRGLDLRALDCASLDLSNAYLRQADLRGLDLSTAKLEGASFHAARISGVLFPRGLDAPEILMSVQLGTRVRYR
jgi:uncharacterized protein YjbI with pentapeptide repeats